MKALLLSALVISVLACVGCSGEAPDDVVPTPTAAPTAESTLEPTVPPTPTITPEPVELWEFDWLGEVMVALPIAVADSGVWFSDRTRATEYAELKRVRTAEEWGALTPDQKQDHFAARVGVPGSGMLYQMEQSDPDWDETFGFGVWNTGTVAETGAMLQDVFQTNILLGRFDPDAVNQQLLGLGYVERSHPGGTYLSLPEGVRLDDGWIRQVTVNSTMRNVLVEERRLITAPSEEKMQAVQLVLAGETPSLMDHAVFGDLARLSPRPIFAVILGRDAVPGPEEMSLGRPLERPEKWGDMGNWEALSAVYENPRIGTKRIAYSFWYATALEAQEGVEELERRFAPSEPAEVHTTSYLFDFCATWEVQLYLPPNGRVAEVSCQTERHKPSDDLGAVLVSALIEGLLGFMVE